MSNRRRPRRRSATVIVLGGIGQAMIWCAIAPVVVTYYLCKALAILVLAVHDVVRYRQHPATVGLIPRNR